MMAIAFSKKGPSLTAHFLSQNKGKGKYRSKQSGGSGANTSGGPQGLEARWTTEPKPGEKRPRPGAQKRTGKAKLAKKIEATKAGIYSLGFCSSPPPYLNVILLSFQIDTSVRSIWGIWDAG